MVELAIKKNRTEIFANSFKLIQTYRRVQA